MKVAKFLLLVGTATMLGACSSCCKDSKSASKIAHVTPSIASGYESGAEVSENMMAEAVNAELHDAEFDRVLFDYDSSKLTNEAKSIINKQVNILKKGSFNIVVEGHTDERGTREYNIGLGERRAQAVKDYLISKGLSGDKIYVISYGKERPAVDEHSPEAWKQNRRSIVIAESN